LIPQSEPPVLVEYGDAVDEGIVGTESRVRQLESGDPAQTIRSRVKDIIFGRKKSKKIKSPSQNVDTNFDTKGVLEEANEKAKLEKTLRDIDESQRQNGRDFIDVSGNRNSVGGGE